MYSSCQGPLPGSLLHADVDGRVRHPDPDRYHLPEAGAADDEDEEGEARGRAAEDSGGWRGQ